MMWYKSHFYCMFKDGENQSALFRIEYNWVKYPIMILLLSTLYYRYQGPGTSQHLSKHDAAVRAFPVYISSSLDV
jgi:hypothetical protein